MKLLAMFLCSMVVFSSISFANSGDYICKNRISDNEPLFVTTPERIQTVLNDNCDKSQPYTVSAGTNLVVVCCIQK